MKNQNNFLVCVRCFTFNHAPYIKDAMDGFCMQQTSFAYVCVVVDDASTDGEQEVIKAYMTQHFKMDDKNVVRNVETDDYVMTFAQNKANENCFFAVYYLKYNHYSIKQDKFSYFSEYHDNAKYIALCEGDDYWIDLLKLQKQVDYMEAHPDCSLVHTHFKYQYGFHFHEDDSLRTFMIDYNDNIIFGILDSNKYRVQTVTVLYKYIDYMKVDPIMRKEFGLFQMGDSQLWIRLSSLGNVKYLPDLTSVYRVCSGSASHPASLSKKLRFSLSCAEMRYYYSCQFNVKKYYFLWGYIKALIKYRTIDYSYKTDSSIIKDSKLVSLFVGLFVNKATVLFAKKYMENFMRKEII